MHPKGIDKAERGFRVAEGAIGRLQGQMTYREFCDQWYIFLTGAKNIYTALETGAKVSPQSKQWYGAKTRERREDELLQYLYQARHDDEHGLEEVTKLDRGGTFIGGGTPGPDGVTEVSVNIRISGGRIENLANEPVEVIHVPPQAKLATVTPRGTEKFPPPRVHRGRDITGLPPVGAANLALIYLRGLIDEAKGLA